MICASSNANIVKMSKISLHVRPGKVKQKKRAHIHNKKLSIYASVRLTAETKDTKMI